MSVEIAAIGASMGQHGVGASAASAAVSAQPVQAGYGVSLTDLGRFEQALGSAQTRSAGSTPRLEVQAADGPSKAAQALMRPFEHINLEASAIADSAKLAQVAGKDLSPGEMVMLTVRCQEFSFHAQLLSNMANRMSDGVQQLFRQQS